MDDDEYIRIAVVIGAHGLKGRLKIRIISDIYDRFRPGSLVYCGRGDLHEKYVIEEFALQRGNNALMLLAGIGDRSAAESIRGCELYITGAEAERTRSNLEPDTFYYRDLIGCEARIRGKRFGTVTRILEAGAGEVLVVSDEREKEHLIPFVESMVDTSAIGMRVLEIAPIEGLLDI